MKPFSLAPLGLLLTLPIALSGCAASIAQPTPQPTLSPLPTPSAASANTPQRLTITVSVAEPADLKVKEGQDLQTGQLIADKSRDRQRLEAQRLQFNLSLQRLKTATITPPLPPKTAPTVTALPEPSYLEEEAVVERSKASVEQAEQTIELKRQEIIYLQSLAHIEPIILEHEQAKLKELQSEHSVAIREYQLAIGKLATAKNAYANLEYQHSITLAQSGEVRNRDGLEYQQQLASYEQRLRERDFQLSQTQLKLNEIDNAIASVAVVKAPYSGRIRRIKWMGQNPDGSLSVQLTLIVANGSANGDRHALPDQPTGMHQPVERGGDRPQ
jgi:hypothetical protein